jgi:lipopolysaccharide transport system ATP-binding protein
LSDDVVIQFESVTKSFPVPSPVGRHFKQVLLNLPRYLAERRKGERFVALREVSLEVRRGACLGIIGRNGSGKSTLLSLIAGVIQPTTGRVRTVGHICPLLELGAGFHSELTGRDNVFLNGVLLGMTRRQVRERFDRIVEFSELGDFLDRPLRMYSSGMIARLGFSVAVHMDPDILLIDEVLAVGDEPFQHKCLERMKQFHARGVTMVFVSHQLDQIHKVADRVARLDHGRVSTPGVAEQVVAAYEAESAVEQDA